MTDPVIEVTPHCPRCGEQLVGRTIITNVAVHYESVTVGLETVHINHKCRSPQDKR